MQENLYTLVNFSEILIDITANGRNMKCMRNRVWKPKTTESRLVFWFKEIGPNTTTYARDLGQEYITGPYNLRDPIAAITGPIMAARSIILEGPDQLIAGAVDQKVTPPSGTLGRMRRDGSEALKNLITLHPIKALTAGFRFATSDLLLDAGDMVGGFHQSKSYAQAT